MSRAELRRLLTELHAELPANDLVSWTSGNISARIGTENAMLIKPSGVRYEDLGPENMVEVVLDTLESEGTFKPSSDTATHAYIYEHLEEVGGIVHTHSPHATAWSALGRDIPCVLTAMADEFGGPIPCGGFALIGGQEIGREVVRVLDGHRSPAVLLRNHGVFAVGPDPIAAVKAAVMTEDAARTVWLAHQLGEPVPIDSEDVDSLFRRYQNDYGQ